MIFTLFSFKDRKAALSRTDNWFRKIQETVMATKKSQEESVGRRYEEEEKEGGELGGDENGRELGNEEARMRKQRTGSVVSPLLLENKMNELK